MFQFYTSKGMADGTCKSYINLDLIYMIHTF